MRKNIGIVPPERPDGKRFGLQRCGPFTLQTTAFVQLGGQTAYSGRVWFCGYELVHIQASTLEEAESRAKEVLQETWPEAEWTILGYEWN
jgi:hypothetical protein